MKKAFQIEPTLLLTGWRIICWNPKNQFFGLNENIEFNPTFFGPIGIKKPRRKHD